MNSQVLASQDISVIVPHRVIKSNRGNVLIIPSKNSKFQKHIVLIDTDFDSIFDTMIKDLNKNKIDKIIFKDNQIANSSSLMTKPLHNLGAELEFKIVRELDKVVLAHLHKFKLSVTSEITETREIPNNQPVELVSTYDGCEFYVKNPLCEDVYMERTANIVITPSSSVKIDYADKIKNRVPCSPRDMFFYRILNAESKFGRIIESIRKNNGDLSFTALDGNTLLNVKFYGGECSYCSKFPFEIPEQKLLELSKQYLISFPIKIIGLKYKKLGKIGMPKIFCEYVVYAGGKKYTKRMKVIKNTKIAQIDGTLKDELGFFVKDLSTNKIVCSFAAEPGIIYKSDTEGFLNKLSTLEVIKEVPVSESDVEIKWLYRKSTKNLKNLLSLRDLENLLYAYGFPVFRSVSGRKTTTSCRVYAPKVAGVKMIGDKLKVEVNSSVPPGYSVMIKDMSGWASNKIKEITNKKRLVRKSVNDLPVPEILKVWALNDYRDKMKRQIYCERLIRYSYSSKPDKVITILNDCKELIPIVKDFFDDSSLSSEAVKEKMFFKIKEELIGTSQNLVIVFVEYLNSIQTRNTNEQFADFLNQAKSAIYSVIRAFVKSQNTDNLNQVIVSILPVMRAAVKFVLKKRGYYIGQGILFRARTTDELREKIVKGLGIELGRLNFDLNSNTGADLTLWIDDDLRLTIARFLEAED